MLVTYSLTIRRLQEEAAKCYTDPDEQLRMMRRPSDQLRRHRSSSKIRSSASKKSSFKDHSSFSQSALETDQKTHHLECPYVSYFFAHTIIFILFFCFLEFALHHLQYR